MFIPSIRTEPEHANHQKCTTMPTSVANSAKQEKHFTSRDKQSSLQERVETNTHIAMIPGSVSAAQQSMPVQASRSGYYSHAARCAQGQPPTTAVRACTTRLCSCAYSSVLHIVMCLL